MTVACLGWGSLVWDPRNLPVGSGEEVWKEDGPLLPIEFARRSSRDRLTLVLIEERNWLRIPVLWTLMQTNNLQSAIQDLATREGTDDVKVGRWPSAERAYAFAGAIKTWAIGMGVDSVVWTALGPNFGNGGSSMPTLEETLSYLGGLRAIGRIERAAEYVRKTPPQIRTTYRLAIEEWLSRTG